MININSTFHISNDCTVAVKRMLHVKHSGSVRIVYRNSSIVGIVSFIVHNETIVDEVEGVGACLERMLNHFFH